MLFRSTVEINETLTYNELYLSEYNFWTFLYLTGYLTKAANEKVKEYRLHPSEEETCLAIPNREVRSIFVHSIKEWFKNFISKYNREALFDSFWRGDTDVFYKELSIALKKSISYYDYDENFYHAFITGIFYGSGYTALSNREGGTGRMDILVLDEDRSWASVIEIKHTDRMNDLPKMADAALAQIEKNEYDFSLRDTAHLIRWGLAFCNKRCEVRCRIFT